MLHVACSSNPLCFRCVCALPVVLQIPVPQNRMTPLKTAWLQLYTPITDNLKLDMRMNLKTRKVCAAALGCGGAAYGWTAGQRASSLDGMSAQYSSVPHRYST